MREDWRRRKKKKNFQLQNSMLVSSSAADEVETDESDIHSHCCYFQDYCDYKSSTSVSRSDSHHHVCCYYSSVNAKEEEEEEVRFHAYEDVIEHEYVNVQVGDER